MIKAKGKTAEGRDLVLVGLSRKNLERLLESKPIVIDTTLQLNIIGGPVIAILGGETEEEIEKELRQHFQLPVPKDVS